jgi:hypothetical protein
MVKLTKQQTKQLHEGYPVNVKGGFFYINEHGDLDFISTDSPVDETVSCFDT